MKTIEDNISRAFRSHWFAWLVVVASMAALVLTRADGLDHSVAWGGGLCFDFIRPAVASPLLSLTLALAAQLAIVLMMVNINIRFNLLRTSSILFVAIFMSLQLAVPEFSRQFVAGSVLCPVVLIVLYIMYKSYMKFNNTRLVYLGFLLLAVGATTQSAFLPYMLVFLLGCGQMRCLSMRMILAAILAFITPLWILWGFGYVSFGDLHLWQTTNIFTELTTQEIVRVMLSAALTIVAMLVFGILNITTVIAYNAKSRAFNGLLMLVGVASGLLCMVDYGNIPAYLATLNGCTAYQIALFFRINYRSRGYLPVLITMLLYVGFFVWSLIS